MSTQVPSRKPDPTVPYVVYDKDTGAIIKSGFCPRSLAPKQARGANQKAMEGRGRDNTQNVNVKTGRINKKETN